MISDEDRREVARRLRYEADYPGYAVQYMEQFIGDLRQVLFEDLNPTADYSEMFARLADLIEPVERMCLYYDADTNHCGCYDTWLIDRDAPQKVAEEMFGKMRHSTKGESDAYDAMLKSKSVEIHPVDRDALLALAEELDGLGLSGFSSGWSVGMVNVGYFARRIREACGEVE